MQIKYQELPKISEFFAQEKKVLVVLVQNFITKDADFIELSHILLFNPAILLQMTEAKMKVFMEHDSKMKISKLNMINQELFQWLIAAVIQMVVNFLLHLLTRHGLTAVMLLSEK